MAVKTQATKDRFSTCLTELFGHEGGYSNRPLRDDPGGATNLGVTQGTYDAWNRVSGHPPKNVRQITKAEAIAIYRRNYWDAVRADELPVGVDICAFDFAVNSGPARATKYLQKTLGVVADGHIGFETLDAVKQADQPNLIKRYVAARRKFGRGLGNYRANPGWETRWNKVERSALAACGSIAPVIAEAPADPDAQAEHMGRAVGDPPNPAVAAARTGEAGAVATASAAGAMAYLQPYADFVREYGWEMAAVAGFVLIAYLAWVKHRAKQEAFA